ncbi:MAG: type I-U CRISPR-associated helicase/endonuclease Cas3 [Acidimicrobiales bacterium]|nr:type I-U CRISPR-associated helicase/endonuclease Cas3 [Acidimicrobiales bacterium]
MSELPSMPTFVEFHESVNGGRAPFPWQARLAEQVLATGWPTEIGVPTGLGKTTCLDIAVWALASQADLPPRDRTLPTRIWYVVNRRLLVDAAYDRAARLAELLSMGLREDESLGGNQVEALNAVAKRLVHLRGFNPESVENEPLVVSRLRGGADLGARPPAPSWPAVILATVPMFGSAWLFRGYASSASTRPIDAALAGVDSLVLVDEAHLAAPLLALEEPLAECDLIDSSGLLPAQRSRPQIVSLTATGDADDPFTLGDDDRENPIVRQRLDAHKPIRLVEVAKKAEGIDAELVRNTVEAVSSRSEPVATVVFANTAKQARKVFDGLRKEASKAKSPLHGADLVLVTGRMRTFEAEAARAAILDRVSGAPADRDPGIARERDLIVVATQTLEVGADLDFDILVTESCGTRALVQRLGRLNRLGNKPDASGVIVHPAQQKEWPIYGEEPQALWARLQEAAQQQVVDLSPAVINDVVGAPSDHPPRVPEVLPGLVWEWVKTSRPPEGEAPVNLYFEGFDNQGPSVSFCWRATRFAPGDRLVPSVVEDEVIDVPFGEAVEALRAVFAGGSVTILDRRDRVTLREIRVDAVRPGDTIVLSAVAGLCDEFGWNPAYRGEVLDVSLSRWPGVPLELQSLQHWFEDDEAFEDLRLLLKQLGAEDIDADFDAIAGELVEILRRVIPRPQVEEDWVEIVNSLSNNPKIDATDSVPLLTYQAPTKRRRGSVLVAADAFDDLSADVRSVRLSDHLGSVGELARRIGVALGLSDELVAAVEAAGKFHDLGKADPRFQRWLDPRGQAADPVAKSTTPRWRWRADRAISGWPPGGRHEALSARLVMEWLADTDDPGWDSELVTHLVITHHGFGRPLIDPVADEEATFCEAEIEGRTVTVEGDLSVVDWDQPARFRRCCERYGYWGLALLETIVRQADWLASGQVEVA